MIKNYEPKEIKDLRAAIANHEKALEGAQAAADEAATALETFVRREIADQLKHQPPGRSNVVFLPPSAERDRLERERVAATAEVNRLGVKLDMLRDILKRAVEQV
jgi:hypothetical protein